MTSDNLLDRLAPAARAVADRMWIDVVMAGRVDGESIVANCRDAVRDGDAATLICEAMPYRCVVARRQPGIEALPVAVSGVVVTVLAGEAWVLLGRRSPATASGSGRWETPPSGALEAGDADYHDRVNQELREETGINPEAVVSRLTLGVIFDDDDRVADIAVRLDIPPSFLREDCWRTPEYSELRFARLRQVRSEVDPQAFVPTSWALLNQLDDDLQS